MLKIFPRFAVRIPLFLSCLFGLNSSSAQNLSTDSSSEQVSLKNAIDDYYKSIGENNHLNNGSEYVSPLYRENMHPFYNSIQFSPGSVTYDQITYHNIPLMYDIIRDVLITNRYNMNYRIYLVNDKIKSFVLFGHTFVRLVQDSLNKSQIVTGFYDRLYDGKEKVYVKRQKKAEEVVKENELISRIVENDIFLVKKGQTYYPVQNKKSLLSVFIDHKSDIRKYLRRNNFWFKENPEYTIMKTAEYYDQIKN
jgi:hypothetical protein